ncbi:MAG: methyl-accepting chemotaxis protein, partial [Pseudomonadota bacterium]
SGIMSILTFQEFSTAFQKNTTETTTGFETLISSVQKVTEEAEVAFGVIDSQIVDMETSTQTALQTIETSVNLTLDQELPKLIEVFSIAERSKTIIAAAPTLVAATNTKMLEERFGALTEANEEMTAMVTKLAADESFDQKQIKTLTDAAAGLSASLAGLKTLVEERLATDSKIATQLQEGEKVRSAALEVLERITDQEISQSIRNINQLSASDITLLVALAELRSGTNRLSGTLSQGAAASSGRGLIAARRSFTDLADGLKGPLQSLQIERGEDISSGFLGALEELTKLGDPQGGVFFNKGLSLGFISKTEHILDQARIASGKMADVVTALVQTSSDRIAEQSGNAKEAMAGSGSMIKSTVEELSSLATERTAMLTISKIQLDESAQRNINSVTVSASNLEADLEDRRMILMILTGVGILIALASAGYIVVGVAQRLGHLGTAMHKVAEGDLQAEIPRYRTVDEITRMARDLEVFRDTTAEVGEQKDRASRERAQARAKRRDELLQIASGFESSVLGVVESVSDSAEQMRVTSEVMAKNADATTDQAEDLTNNAQMTTSNVQTVAAAAEELSASIGEIGRQVSEASRVAGDAAARAQETDTQITGLSQAAQRIGDVVMLISQIAEQTNLLALNATIEAARAGDAGKGFAVVAAEVKTLATETAKATEEIEGQVTSIQSETGSAVAAIRSIVETVNQINSIAASIASAVEEQSASTQEIARNVQQAAEGTSHVSSGLDTVSSAANETGTAARAVLDAVDVLKSQSQSLRGQVGDFLDTIRADDRESA